MAQAATDKSQGFLQGIRILELADEKGEYCGKVLAGVGADVIKVEPPDGSPTRKIGPFYEDKAHPDRSLHFWHYNFGKRGVTLDLETPKGKELFRELAKRADIFLESTPKGYLSRLGLDYDALKKLNPGLIVSRITPFGDTGPWSDYKASDLVQLALGGVVFNNGYDAEPDGHYETSPIAPQMWQAYHIGGELAAIAIMGALYYRNNTGKGQFLHTAIHDVIAKQTEGDVPDWVYSAKPHFRQTGRHSAYQRGPNPLSLTKDGRYIMTSAGVFGTGAFDPVIATLKKHGMQEDLEDPKYQDAGYRANQATQINGVLQRFVAKFLFERDIWRDAQAEGLVWCPERRPEENLKDPHWGHRESFLQVEHSDLGKTFTYVGGKWMSEQVGWRKGPRPPLLGEHNAEILGPLLKEPVRSIKPRTPNVQPLTSKHGKPFALTGVKVVDMTWLLASGGGPRYLSALGAEVIKVEHNSHPDFIRWGTGTAPMSKAERDAASGPMEIPRPASPNRGGFFSEINAGRRSLSLNIQTPKGKEILIRLLKEANVVCEGFTPGTMDRLGLGWKELQKINPSIVYVQQSGMGQIGLYGRSRSLGPIAAGFSGLTEMSGLPEAFPPAGIGYSYLDWFGAYNLATGIMAGLAYQQATGQGVWIDSSQVETGIYLNGSAILDYTVNGRRWNRYGNRSPYKPAAPSGVYKAQGDNNRHYGDDRWIAVSCFTQDEWKALVKGMGTPAWTKDAKFATLRGRLANEDELDRYMNEETQKWDRYKLQEALQKAGVPAGAVQTAEDRYENDPQLRHLDWMVDLKHSEIGTWPVKEFPVKFSDTPAYMGGVIDRHGPCYGEDNDWVLGTKLGMSAAQIKQLVSEKVLS